MRLAVTDRVVETGGKYVLAPKEVGAWLIRAAVPASSLLLVFSGPSAGRGRRLAGRARTLHPNIDAECVRSAFGARLAAPELHKNISSRSLSAADKCLARLPMAGIQIACELGGHRSRGRRTGTCRREGLEVGEAVIAAGLARDCQDFQPESACRD